MDLVFIVKSDRTELAGSQIDASVQLDHFHIEQRLGECVGIDHHPMICQEQSIVILHVGYGRTGQLLAPGNPIPVLWGSEREFAISTRPGAFAADILSPHVDYRFSLPSSGIRKLAISRL